MTADIAIRLDGISKCYQIYDKPHDRLKQSIYPRLQKIFGQSPNTYFREFWALKNVSFEVRKGETVGIIGRNGAGKSTLLQVLCGTLTPTAGSIQVNGRIAALLELGAGFNPEFTGRENVYMNAGILGLATSEIDARYADIAAFADIGDFIDRPVKSYSSGMYVRLAFAVIAHVDADILIVDEALAVGDALFTQKCMRFIREFQQRGALIFVSHDMSSVLNLCNKAVWLDSGHVEAIGDAKKVCDIYINDIYRRLNQESDAPAEAIQPEENVPVSIERIGGDQGLWADQRTEFINASNLRNELEVFAFNLECSQEYGGEIAEITEVYLRDTSGKNLMWVVGGEKVCLHINAFVRQDLDQPIMGFTIKDKLGQPLFGDNTYLSYRTSPNPVKAGQFIAAEFIFVMPWLRKGDYSIQVAIADGTQDDHRHLHWIHDAVLFTSHHGPAHTGMIGIPMIDIRLISP